MHVWPRLVGLWGPLTTRGCVRRCVGAEWRGVWWGGVSPPQPTRGSGERHKLPQWGPGHSENGFWRILKATERSFLYLYDLYDKIWGEQFALTSPTLNSGGLVLTAFPVIYSHGCVLVVKRLNQLARPATGLSSAVSDRGSLWRRRQRDAERCDRRRSTTGGDSHTGGGRASSNQHHQRHSLHHVRRYTPSLITFPSAASQLVTRWRTSV